MTIERLSDTAAIVFPSTAARVLFGRRVRSAFRDRRGCWRWENDGAPVDATTAHSLSAALSP